MTTDTGQFIGELIQERDDLRGTLRLRETDVRLLERRVRERDEEIARLNVLLRRIEEVAERERNAGAVARFVAEEREKLRP